MNNKLLLQLLVVSAFAGTLIEASQITGTLIQPSQVMEIPIYLTNKTSGMIFLTSKGSNQSVGIYPNTTYKSIINTNQTYLTNLTDVQGYTVQSAFFTFVQPAKIRASSYNNSSSTMGESKMMDAPTQNITIYGDANGISISAS